MSLTLWSACTGAAQAGRPGLLPGEELEVGSDSPALAAPPVHAEGAGTCPPAWGSHALSLRRCLWASSLRAEAAPELSQELRPSLSSSGPRSSPGQCE